MTADNPLTAEPKQGSEISLNKPKLIIFSGILLTSDENAKFVK